MSWLFSQALVAEFSADICSGGEPSAPLNVMPTQHKFWRNDKTMKPSALSRFGLTCAVLTESRGEELLTSFLAAFPAKTFHQPEAVPGSKALDRDCGVKWHELSARYDLDTSTWKTHQCLWVEDLPWSSVTLPKWGMTRSGALFQHPTAERPISATASGLWQTIVTDDAASRPGGKQNSRGEPKLSAEMMLWPTPTVHGNHNQPGSSKNAGWGLSSAVKLWPTPTRSDGTGGPGNQGRSEGPNLRTAVSRSWPTPCASASKGSSPASLVRKTGKSRSNDRIDHAVMASDGGQLNPAWVEWLMGWPIGWTELKPLAMDKFREWQRQHSVFWPDNTTRASPQPTFATLGLEADKPCKS